MLSESAAKEIKEIIKKESEEGRLDPATASLRVAVKGGGCSGFSFVLDLTGDAPTDMDEQTESHGVKILCDMKSSLYLCGEKGDTEIDFLDEGMRRGFVFKNPNATSTCGCGSSFSA